MALFQLHPGGLSKNDHICFVIYFHPGVTRHLIRVRGAVPLWPLVKGSRSISWVAPRTVFNTGSLRSFVQTKDRRRKKPYDSSPYIGPSTDYKLDIVLSDALER